MNATSRTLSPNRSTPVSESVNHPEGGEVREGCWRRPGLTRSSLLVGLNDLAEVFVDARFVGHRTQELCHAGFPYMFGACIVPPTTHLFVVISVIVDPGNVA